MKSPVAVKILAGACIENEVYVTALCGLEPKYNCLDWIGIFSGSTVDVNGVILDALLNVLANSLLVLGQIKFHCHLSQIESRTLQ